MDSVSVVIPVKNGLETIKRCLDGILAQTVDVKEIVVVDSGSTDGTIELLKTYDKVKLIEIAPKDFNHGETRNLGVRHATGDVVVLTVQDAWPVDGFWIEKLLEGLKVNNAVAVCGQQVVPHSRNMNPAQWFRPNSEPQLITYRFSADEFNALPPATMKQVCSLDNVTALYRRDVLLKLPFDYTIFAEDATWAKRALSSGYTIAYNYAARVYHYHHESSEFAYRRAFAEMYSTYRIFGITPERPQYTMRYYLRLLKLLAIAKGLPLGEKVRWWTYNLNLGKAYRKACEDFLKMLHKGQAALEELYFQLCSNISAPEYQKLAAENPKNIP